MAIPKSEKAPLSDHPDRILTDLGAGFAIGGIGGTAFHFLKGLRSSPSGARFIGGAQAVRMNVPGVAWRWATWFGLYSTFDCAFEYARQKESRWNSILAAGAASGLLSMRQGFLPLGKAALGGALCMAFIEGVNLTFYRPVITQQQKKMPPVMVREVRVPPKMEDTLSSFGGFVRKKTEEMKSYVKDTVLESCDPPPNFDFE